MEMNKSIPYKLASRRVECEYSLVVIAKTNLEYAYGIEVKDSSENNVLCVKEIGNDKNVALSIIDVLNKYRIPYVHFLDVVSDLMNE